MCLFTIKATKATGDVDRQLRLFIEAKIGCIVAVSHHKSSKHGIVYMNSQAIPPIVIKQSLVRIVLE